MHDDLFIMPSSVTYLYTFWITFSKFTIENTRTHTIPIKVFFCLCVYRKRRFNGVQKPFDVISCISLFSQSLSFHDISNEISYSFSSGSNSTTDERAHTKQTKKKKKLIYKCFTFAFAPLNEASNLCEISARNYR